MIDAKAIETGFVSLISNSWLTSIMKNGDNLAAKDAPILPKNSADTELLVEPYLAQVGQFLRRQRKDFPNIYFHLLKIFKWEIVAISLLQLLSMLMTAFKPLLIGQFLAYLDPQQSAHLWSNDITLPLAAIFTISIVTPILDSIANSLSAKSQVNFWVLMNTLLYKKTLKLSAESRVKYQTGNLLNIYGSDSAKIYQGLTAFNSCIFPIIQVVTNILFLQSLIGLTTVYTCIAYILAFIPVVMMQIRIQQLATKSDMLVDTKINHLRDIFKSIKNIKLSNVENYFFDIVKANIDQDMDVARIIYLLNRVSFTVTTGLSTLLSCLTFVIYSILGSTLNPAVIFPAYMYLDQISSQLVTLKEIFEVAMVVYEGYNIVTKFMSASEKRDTNDNTGSRLAIELVGTTWKWFDPVYIKEAHDLEMKKIRYIGKYRKQTLERKANENTFQLKDVNLDIEKGKTIGVVGTVGAGKSTLLSGIARELDYNSGKMHIDGTIAYFTQQPWLMMDTIESNITFGQELDQQKLDHIIEICGLKMDIDGLDNGIHTLVGESGVNLSGGQKARVSLARCIYSDSDIYLLDDPLASIDARVGRQVFEAAIKNELKGKTVLFSTHQLQYMNQMDEIIVIDKGRLVERGTFEELNQIDSGYFKKMIENFHFDEELENDTKETVIETQSKQVSKKTEDIIRKEQSKTVFFF
ncbi:ATP-binding cassette sub- C member 8 [Boothiomyces macroporosus]|uniref:ATP-binding cassette sub- C member 8 n=1 Tax=Boothiomyces macroporosus TaxID=261099 RepID=A0AAD5UDI4_9FUNG|nr:ATP-binding cassette sub- C member 8 [Boothiomyces macroporosus]